MEIHQLERRNPELDIRFLGGFQTSIRLSFDNQPARIACPYSLARFSMTTPKGSTRQVDYSVASIVVVVLIAAMGWIQSQVSGRDENMVEIHEEVHKNALDIAVLKQAVTDISRKTSSN